MTTIHGRRACPICEGTSRTLIAAIPLAPSDFTSAEAIEVVTCDACGFGFSAEEMPQVELDARYEERSKYATHVPPPNTTRPEGASRRDEPEWDLERLSDTARYLAKRLPLDGPLLDVGCATGALLAALESVGFTQLFGLDPSPKAVQTAAETTHARVYVGSIAFPPDDLPRISAISIAHVLEHVGDVRGVLRAIHHALADDGVLYVEVPDATRYRDHVVAPYQDFNTEHINHFSPELLDLAVTQAGFERIEIVRHTVRCSRLDPYPVVFGLWRRLDHAPVEPSVPESDPHSARVLHDALVDYADLSRRRIDEVDAALRSVLTPGDGVAIWGSGELVLKLLRSTVLADCVIDAIVDASPAKQGRRVGNLEVLAPSALVGGDTPVIIASLAHGEAIAEAARALLGASRRLITLPRPGSHG